MYIYIYIYIYIHTHTHERPDRKETGGPLVVTYHPCFCNLMLS